MAFGATFGPHSADPADASNALFCHLAGGWFDVSHMAVSRSWATIMSALLPEMLRLAYCREDASRFQGWRELASKRLRTCALQIHWLSALVSDSMREHPLSGQLLDMVLTRATVEVLFQPWVEEQFQAAEHMAIQDGDPGPGTLSAFSVRLAGQVDCTLVISLMESVFSDVELNGKLMSTFEDGFTLHGEGGTFRHAGDDVPFFSAERAFRKLDARRYATRDADPFVQWMRTTYGHAAAAAVLQHLMERYVEWLEDGRQLLWRAKVCDPRTKCWLLPSQMIRHLAMHHPLYSGSDGCDRLAVELENLLEVLVSEVL